METANIRQDIRHDDWHMLIGFDGDVLVHYKGIERNYQIPEEIEMIKHHDEYVFLHIKGEDKFYQFKFEVDSFLVGDIFTNDGEHIDSFANYVFE